MKTKLYSSLTLIIFFITGYSQVDQAELIPASDISAYLDVNNISTLVTNGAYLWEDQNTGLGQHRAKDSNRLVGYGASIWMAGKTDAEFVKCAAELYSRDYDFYVGPYSTSGIKSDFEKYNRVWKINRWQVEDFIANRSRPNYVIPEVILTWPAHGDESLGQAKNLAPFHDTNGDGIYNPYDGDYPEFDVNNNLPCDADKLLGDQVIYTIFHDAGDHTESNGIQIGAEIHLQAYAFASNDELNNTVFYKYDVYNRSTTNLKEFYFGFYHDGDIGCSGDDFIGTCESRGLSYIYNGTLVDGAECFGTEPWVGTKAILGVDFVNSPLAKATNSAYWNRAGTSPSYGLDPSAPVDFYNYMKSVWLDGTHFVEGGTGHQSDPNANSSVDVNYTFNDNVGWTEASNNSVVGDRRGMLSVGPVDFNSGDKLTYTIAALYDKVDVDGSYTDHDEIDKLKLTDDKIQSYVDNCFSGRPCLPPQAQMEIVSNDQYFQFAYPFAATKVSWDFGDGIVAPGQYQIHKYSSLGDFNVCVTVETDCGEDTYCEQISITTLGVNENDKVLVEVYPNPSNGIGEIKLAGISESVILNITDLTGRRVTTLSSNGASSIAFNLPSTTAFYLYEIVGENNEIISTGKIVVE